MSRQHYVPAVYLGRWSSMSGPPRDRPVYVLRRGDNRAQRAKARTIGLAKDLYETESSSLAHLDIDKSWNYESSLSPALDKIANPKSIVTADVWASTVLPFVASLFIRGLAFEKEFGKRFDGLPGFRESITMPFQENAALARIVELQALLPLIAASSWMIIHLLPDGEELITNDRGFAPATLMGQTGYVVPVSPLVALFVVSGIRRQVAAWENEAWMATIPRLTLASTELRTLNSRIAAVADRFIVGSSAEALSRAASGEWLQESARVIHLPRDVSPSPHIYDYFRLISALSTSPDTAQEAADRIDWLAVSKVWTAPVDFDLCFPDPTMGGVRVEDDLLIVDLEPGADYMRALRAGAPPTYGRASTLLPVDQVKANWVELSDMASRGFHPRIVESATEDERHPVEQEQ